LARRQLRRSIRQCNSEHFDVDINNRNIRLILVTVIMSFLGNCFGLVFAINRDVYQTYAVNELIPYTAEQITFSLLLTDIFVVLILLGYYFFNECFNFNKYSDRELKHSKIKKADDSFKYGLGATTIIVGLSGLIFAFTFLYFNSMNMIYIILCTILIIGLGIIIFISSRKFLIEMLGSYEKIFTFIVVYLLCFMFVCVAFLLDFSKQVELEGVVSYKNGVSPEIVFMFKNDYPNQITVELKNNDTSMELEIQEENFVKLGKVSMADLKYDNPRIDGKLKSRGIRTNYVKNEYLYYYRIKLKEKFDIELDESEVSITISDDKFLEESGVILTNYLVEDKGEFKYVIEEQSL